MSRSRRYEVAVGLLLAAALVVLGWMAIRVGSFSGFGSKVRVEVAFHDVAGLDSGAFVTSAGVAIGRVEGMSIEGDHAVAVLALDPDAGVRRDARAQIKAKSVIGEKYVAILPGSADAPLAATGDRLQAAGRRVEIDDLVNAVGPLIEGLDPEAMQKALDALGTALDEDPERLSRMLENADVALANVAEASEELPGLAREARSTLAEARAAVREVDARAREAEALVAKADAAMADVQTAAEAAPGLTTEAEAAVRDAREAMARLEEATQGLQTVIDNLAEFDKWEVRRLLREEGVLIRLKKHEVVVPGEDDAEASP